MYLRFKTNFLIVNIITISIRQEAKLCNFVPRLKKIQL
jgi:hypothetical protein